MAQIWPNGCGRISQLCERDPLETPNASLPLLSPLALGGPSTSASTVDLASDYPTTCQLGSAAGSALLHCSTKKIETHRHNLTDKAHRLIYPPSDHHCMSVLQNHCPAAEKEGKNWCDTRPPMKYPKSTDYVHCYM